MLRPSLERRSKDSAEVLPITPDSTRKAVADLQSRLVRLGLLQAGDATGTFGATTANAVAVFQRQRGLRCDGVCGRETWAAVVEAGFALGDRNLYRRAPMFHGDDVAELQRRLSALGFDPGGVDGIFGDRTAEALGEFQRNVGLRADGICGYLTIAELTRLTIRPGGGDLVSTVRERLIVATQVRRCAGEGSPSANRVGLPPVSAPSPGRSPVSVLSLSNSITLTNPSRR